jgi:hypothetical protein
VQTPTPTYVLSGTRDGVETVTQAVGSPKEFRRQTLSLPAQTWPPGPTGSQVLLAVADGAKGRARTPAIVKAARSATRIAGGPPAQDFKLRRGTWEFS